MSILRTFFKGKVKLPTALISVSEAGLQQLHRGLFPGMRKTDIPVAAQSFPQSQKCPECQAELGAAHEIYSRIAVCDHCGYHFVWSAFKRVEHLADPGSFRSIGHAILPVDLLGFVDEQPYAVKLSENQEKTGLSDAILSGRCRIGGTETPRKAVWETVNLARHPDRPTARDYIRYLSPNFLALQGDRCYSDDPAMVAGLGDIAGRSVIFVGQERRRSVQASQGEEIQTRHQPAGYRKAIRMMELAARLRCPLVTFVDTAGADPGIESEKQGISGSLAHCLSTMSDLRVPIVTVIIGEGASGGAVALAVADHILMLQHAIYEVISPEGAATILYRNVQKTWQVAEQLKLTAFDCLRLKVVDAIIPEPLAGAHTDPSAVMQTLQQYLLRAFTALEQVLVKRLLARRYRKFRHYGQFQHKQLQLIRASMRRDWHMAHLRNCRLLMMIATGVSALVARNRQQEHDLASS